MPPRIFPEPSAKSYDPAHLKTLLEKVAAEEDLFGGAKDELLAAFASTPNFATTEETYFIGKQLGHIARLIPIADMSGNEEAKSRLI